MTTTLFQKIALFGVALATLTPAWGQEGVTDYDRFQLWNDCKPIRLLVEDIRGNTYLRKSAVETSVRSRLRSARLYDDASTDIYLYVNVNPVGSSEISPYSINVEFRKYLFDGASGEFGFATTWSTGSAGRGDSAHIMSWISQHTDIFIDEYLRVNESACK